jgi:hypothetical protein
VNYQTIQRDVVLQFLRMVYQYVLDSKMEHLGYYFVNIRYLIKNSNKNMLIDWLKNGSVILSLVMINLGLPLDHMIIQSIFTVSQI